MPKHTNYPTAIDSKLLRHHKWYIIYVWCHQMMS